MQTNNQKKLKNKIFIIWGLFITGVILVFLIILLLAMNKTQPKTDNQNQPTLTSKTNPQQEQEIYNEILNKIKNEVDELTTEKEIVYRIDGKNIHYIKILDSQTKKEIKRINYHDDGKTIFYIETFDSQTGQKIKEDTYKDNGKNIHYSIEYNPITGTKIKMTYYNLDGTIKETKTF